jgi:methylated-DNA-[protein]-cysteine S-methyltransferase
VAGQSVVIRSPVGPLRLESNGAALTGIHLRAAGPPARAPRAGILGETARQLAAYFSRRLERFDLTLALAGTPFQLDVWRTLGEIPYGETWTYSELAARVGRPSAVRAVGAANGANPIPIVIPCHRVIGHDGRLVGFGGGIAMKQALLALERARLF